MQHNQEFILGNASLHTELSTALTVMTQLVCNASLPPSAQALSESMELSVRYLRKLLRTLAEGGLLKTHPEANDTWVCAHPPHMISLADIYRCLMRSKEEVAAPSVTAARMETRASSADLLLMQATMSINQVLLQHLQQFDLGRLKVVESALLFNAPPRVRVPYQMDPEDALVD